VQPLHEELLRTQRATADTELKTAARSHQRDLWDARLLPPVTERGGRWIGDRERNEREEQTKHMGALKNLYDAVRSNNMMHCHWNWSRRANLMFCVCACFLVAFPFVGLSSVFRFFLVLCLT